MADAIHTEPRFNDEDAARAHLESIYWPKGPVCPHCGGTERNTRLNGKAHRPGLLYCADCKRCWALARVRLALRFEPHHNGDRVACAVCDACGLFVPI